MSDARISRGSALPRKMRLIGSFGAPLKSDPVNGHRASDSLPSATVRIPAGAGGSFPAIPAVVEGGASNGATGSPSLQAESAMTNAASDATVLRVGEIIGSFWVHGKRDAQVVSRLTASNVRGKFPCPHTRHDVERTQDYVVLTLSRAHLQLHSAS